MLRWSGEAFGYEIDVKAVAEPAVDSGVPGGELLLGMVDVFLLGAEAEREHSRTRLLDRLGPEAFVDAAAVFGNFEMMNRIAEGTGIPIARQEIDRESEMMSALGLNQTLKSQRR